MPHVESAGAAIHYQVEGRGRPLVLQHGLYQDLEVWRECGWTQGLAGRQLVLIDARGHGRSARPHDPAAYALERRVDDVAAVLDALGIGTADFFGYSMGGWIGFGLARLRPERVAGLVILGQHPYARSLAGYRGEIAAGLAGGPEGFVRALEAQGPLDPAERRRAAGHDFAALMALAQDRDSQAEALPAMAGPALLLAGELDPLCAGARQAAAAMPAARFVPLDGLDHTTSFTDNGRALAEVQAFLQALDLARG